MGKGSFNSNWDWLAACALDSRDAWRGLIPRVDAALAGSTDPAGLLREIRSIAVRHAERLKGGLKHPDRPQRALPRPEKEQPLWRTTGTGGRYVEPRRRNITGGQI
jgi:hypothetical protein